MSDALFGDEEMGAKPYVVLARKYRPQTFDDLIGQDAMVATLKNAFEQGRIAQGYMLTGVRGVGKTTTARILARALNFEPADGSDATTGPTVNLPRERESYGRHCAEIMESRHADVIEMDAASNTGVDNVREIIESARYKPLVARYKVFIIDEVHMLSKGAFNALLKTLEEPPEHVKFIFATTEIRKVPVTVLSRCQRFDLRRVDVPLLTKHFQKIVREEGAEAEDDALMLIARAAEGSVRDGLSILDQAIAFCDGKVTAGDVRDMLGLADRGRIFDLLELAIGGKPAEALEALDGLFKDGADPVQALGDLAETVHLVTRIKTVGPEAGSEGLAAEDVRRAQTVAEKVSFALLSRVWQMLLKGIEETGRAPNPRAAADMVLIRIAYTADLPPPEDVIKALGSARPRASGNGGSAPARPTAEKASPRAERETTVNPKSAAPQEPAAHQAATAPTSPPKPADEPPAWLEEAAPLADSLPIDADYDPEDPLYADAPVATHSLMIDPASFQDVIDLVSAKRDLKMKVHLEEHVSLVKFDRESRAIDLYLLPEAPKELANALRERLNQWTAKKWIVVLSKTEGDLPVAEARRREAAAELERMKSDPAVRAALDAFPDAEVTSVRPLDDGGNKEDTGTG